MTRPALALALLFLATAAIAAPRRHPSVAPSPNPCGAGLVLTGVDSADLVVDVAYVYFSDYAGGVYRVAKVGGQREEVTSVPSAGASLLAVDATHIYFMASPYDHALMNLYVAPKSGGPAETLVSGIENPFAIANDATAVYWTTFGTPADASGDAVRADGTVEKAAKDGSGHLTLAGNLSAPTALVVDDANVYFGESGLAVGSKGSGLRSVPKNGGAVTSLLDGKAIIAVSADAQHVYASALDVVDGSSQIVRVAKSGGAATVIESTSTVLFSLVAAGGKLYVGTYGDEGVEILAYPLAGGAPAVIADGELDGLFAVDECVVFYTSGGSIYRALR